MKQQPVWLGAYSPGGLALPDATPTPAQLYAPRGVFMNDEWLVAADSGNHRILIWRGVPTSDCTPAEIVLGQPDFHSEGPKLLHLPTGVLVHEGRLLVADAWHHRVLVWNEIPTRNSQPPDYAIGQASLDEVQPNRGGAPDAASLYWPYGIGFSGEWFWVADTGNRRVLGWRGLAQSNQPADVVLGQPDAASTEENRGGAVNAQSFRWPHAIAGDASRLLVADAGNHRVLGWSPLPAPDASATLLLGQQDFSHAFEMPHVKQGASRMRFPYSLSLDGDCLAVADTANNRILLWEGGRFPPEAMRVLGQENFDSGGENRWKAVQHDSLCWPYGIWLHGGRLAVADSGNNRLLIWNVSQSGGSTQCVSQSPEESSESTKTPAREWAR